MIRCAILDDYPNVALQSADWSPLAGRVDIRSCNEHFDSTDALARAVGDCEILVAMRERTRFTPALFDALPKLRLLVSTGGRNASIDIPAANAHGVTVCYTGSILTGTLEHTWALLLSLARQVPAENANFHAGGKRWQVSVGADLAGRTLGVIGLGRQGTQVARIAQAFGMRVVAWSPNITPERCAAAGVEHAASLHALMQQSDFVTIHMVLGERTRGLIDAAAIAQMKPGAFLVNTSRGPIVQEAAVVEALRAKRIAGAALDVFDEEPVPLNHPYRGLDRLIVTPHLGYVTQAAMRRYYGDVVEDIQAWLAGKPIRVMVENPDNAPLDAQPRTV